MRRALLLALTAGLALVVVGPGTALGANDRLACQLARPHLVKSTFELPHARFRSFSYSPTGTEKFAPYGADTSECEAILWSQFPVAKKKHFPGGPPHFVMPACCARLRVETIVQDPGSEGDEYDPEKEVSLATEEARSLIDGHGGAIFPTPLYGASQDLAYWFGSERHVAQAFWQVNDGIVEISVEAHTNPRKKLRELALSIVPGFRASG